MLGRVEFQRITVAFPNFQFSIFNILAKGLPRGCQGVLAENSQIVLSTILLVLSTKYFILSRKSIYIHAPLAVHVCTKLGTTAQILQRTCKKSAMCLQKIFVRLTRQTHSPFSEKVSAFLYISTLASNQSCPLVLLDGSDFFNGRLCRIYCKALIF